MIEIEKFKQALRKRPGGVPYPMLLHHALKAAAGLVVVLLTVVVCFLVTTESVSRESKVITIEQFENWWALGTLLAMGFILGELVQCFFPGETDHVVHGKDCASDAWAYGFQLNLFFVVTRDPTIFWIVFPVWVVGWVVMMYRGWAQ